MDGEVEEIIFEPRIGRVARDNSASLLKLRAAVRIAGRMGHARSYRGSGPASGSRPTGPRAHFVKGAGTSARPMLAGQRRVVVKARFVSHGGDKGAPLRVHVAYLARELRQPGREKPEGDRVASKPELETAVSYLSRETDAATHGLSFYSQRESDLDAKTLTSAWADDNRHFRLIVSAEDGAALGDLRPFIREVMAGLEARTGTSLEWLAVDHHDTDNPHTHILVRGKRADGEDLFIPRKVIASGIREHAQEIVTRVLGPRREIDLARERARDIEVRGPSPLDKDLMRSRDRRGRIQAHRPDLIARLERLQGWALAFRERDGWRVTPELNARLKVMATHVEVEKIVSRSRQARHGGKVREADHGVVSMGELVHFGPLDDLGETFLAIVESEQGDLRYTTLERADDLAHLDGMRAGAMVAFEPREIEVRPSDFAVADVAARTGGVYSIAHHAAAAPGASKALMDANVRRLEAMRRAGLVERAPGGVFHIAGDHLDRALAFERKLATRSPLSPRVHSHLGINDQINALGPTRLDRILAGAEEPLAGEGRLVAAEAAALQQRRLFLIDQGIMGTGDERLSAQAVSSMAQAERLDAARRVSLELGVPVLSDIRTSVQGHYVRRVDLAQGRMAIILQDRQAFLVPWRPTLERFAGREVYGARRANGLSWSLASGRSPDLPPM